MTQDDFEALDSGQAQFDDSYVSHYCKALDPVYELLYKLDIAIVERLYLDGDPVKVWHAFDAVLSHPLSTWTPETLDYRNGRLHYPKEQ